MTCQKKNARGWRLHSSGSWNGETSLQVQGGQAVHLRVTNANVLGVVITIATAVASETMTIPPLGTADYFYSHFGNEPMTWRFDISTISDAMVATYCLYSTWIPGDPPNG